MTENPDSNLSAEHIERLIFTLKPFNPFVALAEKGGGDLSNGDCLIVPEEWFRKLPDLEQYRLTPGVHVRADVSQGYLFTKPSFEFPTSFVAS